MTSILGNGTGPTGPTVACDDVRRALARLAIGETLGERALPLARHVGSCPDCDAFVDEVAAMRAWLAAAPLPTEVPYERADLERRAIAALSRELAARLARDLVSLARGDDPRPRSERMTDVQRLTALQGARVWLEGPWCDVLPMLRSDAAPDRERAMLLAARLDPVGMDVALGWLGCLERSGAHMAARDAAERLLFEVAER